MNASLSKTGTALSAARFVLLIACALTLAACETDGTGTSAADAPKAEAALAKPLESPKTEASKPEASKPEASKPEAPKPEGPKTESPKTQAAKPAAQAAEPEEPMTRSRAARECWMKTEKGSANVDLDKRADIVNKCIDDKMKAAGAPAPKT